MLRTSPRGAFGLGAVLGPVTGERGGPLFLCYTDDYSDDQFSWTYYPPSEFQLALWFPDTQTLLVSQA